MDELRTLVLNVRSIILSRNPETWTRPYITIECFYNLAENSIKKPYHTLCV